MIIVSKLAVFLIMDFLIVSGTNVANLDARTEEVFGAQADNRGPIGGGKGYKNLVTRYNYLVKSRDELLAALKKAKRGEIVYVADDAQIDLTFFSKIEIPGGVTLASGRGRNGSVGALVYTTQERTFCMFQTGGEGVRVSGLRLRGPDPNRHDELRKKLYETDRQAYDSYPLSIGIWVLHPKLEVDNCELWAWNSAAIGLWPGSSQTHIHHNYIHHCQLRGLGYGVSVSLGKNEIATLIECNVFDWCRHCIQTPGYEGCSYEARNNIVLENSNDSSFDVHGGRDRADGTDIAGASFNIHHNTFKATKYPAVGIRGRPIQEANIHHNHFFHLTAANAVRQRNAMGNMKVFRNLFGPEKRLVE